MNPTERNRRVGLWLIGARGSVATCVAYGLNGLREGLIEPVGIATSRAPFHRLGLVSLDDLVLGGCDVSRRALTDSAGDLVSSGILPAELVAATSAAAAAYEARLCPGILDEAEVGVGDSDAASVARSAASPRERIAAIQSDVSAFASENDLARVVVFNVASTEAWREPRPECESLEAFEAALDRGVSPPASILYAYAALDAGHPYVNFTPSRGSSIPALRELARDRGVPHAGNDGKTGETLLKTVLAPMFVARALRVLSWQGYNMLGNRDGEVLANPLHLRSKLDSKDTALRAILGDDSAHTKVGIDFVPSLEDWKTAWDFVHFEGFLGVRMSLQMTWSGSDSALAAPLVLDLARFAELAGRRGEVGEMEHTACYFKSPLSGGPHDFHIQFARLIDYAHRAATVK